MKTIVLSLITIGSLSLGLSQTPTHILENYDLIWQDDFDGEDIDWNKWEYRSTGSKRGIGVVRKKNCYVDKKGHLVIEATKEDTTYYIGQICTEHKFQQKYGYFECSAKVNSQLGPASSFWLQSSTFGAVIGDLDSSGTEIDIFEYRQKEGDYLVHHTIHWDGYGKDHQQKGMHKKVKDFDKDFHTFGLEWTEKKYIFYVDGKKTWSTSKSVSHQLEYIILSLELNGWGGDPSNSTFPDKVIYDWVRVYQKKS